MKTKPNRLKTRANDFRKQARIEKHVRERIGRQTAGLARLVLRIKKRLESMDLKKNDTQEN